MKTITLAAALLFGCGQTAALREEPTAAPAPGATASIPSAPDDASSIPSVPAPAPARPVPSTDLFRCPIDTGAPYGHRAAWKAVAGAVSYRVYETEAGERKLTFESALPSVFFSTSAWEPTLVEIVSVDATGAETFVWPPFSQGITMDVFDQLLAVGEDDLGPVLQIRDCVQEASVTDHDPALAVRSLRVPGATELRGLAVAHERREAFLRAADRIFVLRHFTTAGSKRDETGAVRLDLGEVATSAPLGVGGALAFGNDTLYAADGAVLVRIELGSNGWHETARSAPLEHAIQQLEVVGSQIEIVVDVGATKRLLHATWPPTGLVLGEATAIPLTGPVVTASPDRGSNASDLYFAELGGTEILHANGNRVLTSPFGITALSAESKRVYVRDAEGRVSSWSLAGEDAAAFRMPAARVHAQRMLEGLSVIIE